MIKLTLDPVDGNRIHLDDLVAFVERAKSMGLGNTPNRITAQIAFGGQIKKLSIESLTK